MSWMEILMDHCLQPHLHRFDGWGSSSSASSSVSPSLHVFTCIFHFWLTEQRCILRLTSFHLHLRLHLHLRTIFAAKSLGCSCVFVTNVQIIFVFRMFVFKLTRLAWSSEQN
jgi:hypothetical protein